MQNIPAVDAAAARLVTELEFESIPPVALEGRDG